MLVDTEQAHVSTHNSQVAEVTQGGAISLCAAHHTDQHHLRHEQKPGATENTYNVNGKRQFLNCAW